MKAIEPETKRKMAWAWSISLMAIAFPNTRLMFADHSMIPFAVSVLIILPLVGASFPLVIQWGQERGVRIAAEKARKLETYRASPQSHLLP
jgi:hypothetical protein